MTDAGDRYLELVKRLLVRDGFGSTRRELRIDRIPPPARYVYGPLQKLLSTRGLALTAPVPPSDEGETMIGRERLDHLQCCVEAVLRDDVPGDLIETGVWRGGATILMRAVLAARGDNTRIVWAADSFEGFPAPGHRLTVDRAEDFTAGMGEETFRVGLAEVQRNFARYDLLDDQVRFLPGWFSDTLARAPIEQLAVLRLDGDLYASTRDALEALYPKLAPGGFVIVDDFGTYGACRAAVDEYRAELGITEPMQWIDSDAVFWRR